MILAVFKKMFPDALRYLDKKVFSVTRAAPPTCFQYAKLWERFEGTVP